MCTITYFPLQDKSFIVTHNRDEAVNRKALFPDYYEELGAKLFYPKDELAGGTWMGISNKDNLVCIMNGAFGRHARKEEYRKSRGLVVKELMASDDVKGTIENYDFEGIEQFFILLFSWKEKLTIYELVWDGENHFLTEVDTSFPKIWSSAMLYTKEQRNFREEMLSDFLQKHSLNQLTAEEVLDFHRLKFSKEKEGMVINRGFLKTTSISQFSCIKGEKQYFFEDLLQEKQLKWEKMEF